MLVKEASKFAVGGDGYVSLFEHCDLLLEFVSHCFV